MWPFLVRLLDILLPRRERTVRAEHYNLESLTVVPTTHELCGEHITTLLSYKDRSTEDLVRAFKYDNSPHAARLFAELLESFLREEIISLRLFSQKSIVLVPIPLHERRLRERRHNQVETVLRALPRGFHGGPYARLDCDSLVRVKETRSQTHLSRTERLNNMRDAFVLKHPEKLRGSHIFLVDDVVTTGATLSEAARLFHEAKIPVTILTLARA